MKRERAAAALDATHHVGERGPRTMRARALVASWLDVGGRARGLAESVSWLEHVAEIDPPPPSPSFRVWRGSGREPFYRLVLETPDRERAERRYRKIAESLRQGAVVLVRPDGTWELESGPTLRTRW